MSSTQTPVTYSYTEAVEASLSYFDGDDLAAPVFVGKYRHDNEATPDDMHLNRLAPLFAQVEDSYNEPTKKQRAALSDFGKGLSKLTEQEIYDLIKDFKYIVPQGSVMSGLGSESYISLSNCLRLPPPQDSYSSILFTDNILVNAAKRRCGYGLGLSGLRPRGAIVNNAAVTSTGAGSFMNRFSESTREVAQGGRRGACLLDIDVNHPDSMEFAEAKTDTTKVTGANISVKIYDEFMDAVKGDADFYLAYPTNVSSYEISSILGDAGETFPYHVLHNVEHNGEQVYFKKVKALQYWKQFIKLARDNAEPGLFYWDRMIDYDPSSTYPDLRPDGTNACGEQPMAIFDTCRLIAANLFSLVSNPFSPDSKIDSTLAYKVFYIQQRMGDNLVDLEIKYAQRILDKIRRESPDSIEHIPEVTLWEGVIEKAQNGRRTGSGLTGLGDMLAALNVGYGSPEGEIAIREIMKIKMKAELDCSIDLAVTRGSFLSYDQELEFPKGKPGNSFYAMLLEEFPEQVARMALYGRRNVNWNTIAPTGSVSLMTRTTSGCEPLFKAWHTRRKKGNHDDANFRVDFVDQNGDSWQEFYVLHPKFKLWIEEYSGPKFKEDGIKAEDMTPAMLEEYLARSPWAGSEADDIDWEQRVVIQALLQHYTSSAISSTINLPNDVSEEVVEKLYRLGYELGCKGVTVYRDGSRTGVLVNDKSNQDQSFDDNHAPKRPKEVVANVYSFMNHGEKWVGLIGLMEGRPYEIFTGRADALGLIGNVEHGSIRKRKTDDVSAYDFVYTDGYGREHTVEGLSTCFNEEYYNYGKMISGVLRHGMPIPYVVDLVSSIKLDQDHLNTWKAGVARILKRYIKDGTQAVNSTCSECGDPDGIVYQEGCLTCKSCGNAKCG